MPPPRNSHLRKVTDFLGDPWATDEEREAWDRARKEKWLSSLTKRDKQRIISGIRAMGQYDYGGGIDDLDAPIRVGWCRPGFAKYHSGVAFKEVEGFVLMAWEK